MLIFRTVVTINFEAFEIRKVGNTGDGRRTQSSRMVARYFGQVCLFFVLSYTRGDAFYGNASADEWKRGNKGKFLSRLEVDTPEFDGEELFKYHELASRTGTSTWVGESTTDVQALAEAVNCSNGAFDDEWVGSIVVEEIILNANGIGPI